MKYLIAVGSGLAGITALSLTVFSQWTYQHVCMPAMSLLDPERAHKLAVWMSSKGFVPKDKTIDPKCLVSDCKIGLLYKGIDWRWSNATHGGRVD